MRYRNYRDTGIKTSLLGMGCMRLPLIGEDRTKIDYEKAQEIIDYAYAHGVNYYDTAYVYGDGASERFIGQALKKYPRESYYLTDKMPPWQMNTKEDVERLFNIELERCGVEYFDYYLCHNINEETIERFLDPEIGAIPFLEEMQRQGKIRYLGFSSHGKPETLRRFASVRKWDFAQIQLNYLDWELQDAKQQYEILTELGIPVMVMEPVRGGRLASLCPEADELLKEARPDKSIASWALRFVAELPNVQVILSGMSTYDQVVDNVATFSAEDPMTEGEKAALDQALALLKKRFLVPCTACHYCDGCPMGLDIPTLLSTYNEYALDKAPFSLMPITELPEEHQPKQCIACGACTQHCPQHIDIPGIMSALAEAVEKIPPRP